MYTLPVNTERETDGVTNPPSARRATWAADPAAVILLAPVVFALHVAEEAPSFVAWFNSLVTPGISQGSFLRVNATALLITVTLAILTRTTKDKLSALATLAWLGFLMLANGLFHAVAALVHARYSPGVVTGLVLYLPYFAWYLRATVRRCGVGLTLVGAIVAGGALPMLLHGYLIVFRGSRLF